MSLFADPDSSLHQELEEFSSGSFRSSPLTLFPWVSFFPFGEGAHSRLGHQSRLLPDAALKSPHFPQEREEGERQNTVLHPVLPPRTLGAAWMGAVGRSRASVRRCPVVPAPAPGVGGCLGRLGPL